MKNKTKCFKCKKNISTRDISAISFYSMHSIEEDKEEYDFCDESCLQGFFRDRIEFNAIVKKFESD